MGFRPFRHYDALNEFIPFFLFIYLFFFSPSSYTLIIQTDFTQIMSRVKRRSEFIYIHSFICNEVDDDTFVKYY